MKCSRCVFWWAGITAVITAAVVTVIVLHESLLTAAGAHLLRDDVPETDAPYGVVLMGDLTTTRVERAVGLYRLGTIHNIILMREKDHLFRGTPSDIAPADVFRDYLYREGIPPENVLFLADCETTSTVDEAQCVKAYFKGIKQPPPRVVVITTWTHSARAGWTFEKILAPMKIEMAAARLDVVIPQNWWKHEVGVLSVYNEYLKWAYWKLKDWRGEISSS